mmetsp:Transcript_8019/g.22053  ORF Transcript_8019/g.22053 Transcript_8019/m.22053 type:complete len:240 (+) Transcript_8019:602-1321(+)
MSFSPATGSSSSPTLASPLSSPWTPRARPSTSTHSCEMWWARSPTWPPRCSRASAAATQARQRMSGAVVCACSRSSPASSPSTWRTRGTGASAGWPGSRPEATCARASSSLRSTSGPAPSRARCRTSLTASSASIPPCASLLMRRLSTRGCAWSTPTWPKRTTRTTKTLGSPTARTLPRRPRQCHSWRACPLPCASGPIMRQFWALVVRHPMHRGWRPPSPRAPRAAGLASRSSGRASP